MIVDCSTGGEQEATAAMALPSRAMVVLSPIGAVPPTWFRMIRMEPTTSLKALLSLNRAPGSLRHRHPGCAGPHVHSGLNAPKIGNAQFTVKCTAAPPNGLGGWWIADTQDLVGSDPFGVGIKLHLDLFNAVEFFAFGLYADASGVATAAVGIPSNPVLVGKTYYSQVVWAWPLTTCHNFPYGLSSSNGISITIQQ